MRRDRICRVTSNSRYSLSCYATRYLVFMSCADNSARDRNCAVPVVFRSQLECVDMSAMMHQMNQLDLAAAAPPTC